MVSGVGSAFRSPAYKANLALPGGVRLRDMRVTMGAGLRTDVLISMDVITLGDFAVSNYGSRTVFSFRVPSLRHIDFVAEAQT
jgi:hypothetical protein